MNTMEAVLQQLRVRDDRIPRRTQDVLQGQRDARNLLLGAFSSLAHSCRYALPLSPNGNVHDGHEYR